MTEPGVNKGNALYTVSVYCHNDGKLAALAVDGLVKRNPGVPLEIIITSDASTDDSLATLEKAASGKPYVRVIKNGVSTGYTACHNRALEVASGEYFVVLSPGFVVEEDGWLTSMSDTLGPGGEVEVCGIKGTPCAIDEDARGSFDERRREYADGACLMVRTAFAGENGLFSPEMPFGFHADMDLSLRYSQMGRTVAHASLKYSSVPAAQAERGAIGQIMAAAKRRFAIRWNGYLKNRRFSNRVLVVTEHTTGLGDQLCVTPALRALRRAHPAAEITLETSAPELFSGNPCIDRLAASGSEDRDGFDSVLMPGVSSYYHGRRTIPHRLAHDMGLVLDDISLDFFEDGADRSGFLEGLDLEKEGYYVVSLGSGHDADGWEGRSLSLKAARGVCEAILGRGVKVVQAGAGLPDLMQGVDGFVSVVDKTGFQELAYLLKNARGAVLADSFPFHLAQAVGTRTLGVFGATLPECRITDYSFVDWVTHPELDCIGCYMRKPEGGYNRCLREDIACMLGFPDGYLGERVVRFIDGDMPVLAHSHRVLVERALSVADDSEAMSQDIMASYGVLKDMFMSGPLKLGRVLDKLGPLRPLSRKLINSVKSRLARIGQ